MTISADVNKVKNEPEWCDSWYAALPRVGGAGDLGMNAVSYRAAVRPCNSATKSSANKKLKPGSSTLLKGKEIR